MALKDESKALVAFIVSLVAIVVNGYVLITFRPSFPVALFFWFGLGFASIVFFSSIVDLM